MGEEARAGGEQRGDEAGVEREKRQEQLDVRGAETERAAVEVEGLEGGRGGGSGAPEVRPRGEDGGDKSINPCEETTCNA